MMCIATPRHRSSRLVFLAAVFAASTAAGCGGGGSSAPDTSDPASGDNSWSVDQNDVGSGALVSCVNYTHQRYTAAQAMTMVKGGAVSANPCPVATNIVGVCTGVDAGGNDFAQVFYNYNGLTGAALSAGLQSLMLSCGSMHGTWSTTYDGMFETKTTAGGAGGSSGGAGGTGGGDSCGQLLACCNASGQLKQACMATYNASGGNAMSCATVLSSIRSLYCP